MKLTLAALLVATSAVAASPREELKAVIVQINAKPADRALRVKAIGLAGKIKPSPAVPPEAKRAFVMAVTYQKEAKNPSDFTQAIDSFQDALKIAPWWGDAYYNLSVSQESAGRLDEAKDALELYLLTKPKDAEEAQNRVYALEAKRNIASKQAAAASNAAAASAAEAAAKARAESSIEGGWWVVYQNGMSSLEFTVLRTGGSFDVVPTIPGTTVADVQATETTLHFTSRWGTGVTTYDLKREGAVLAGMTRLVITNVGSTADNTWHQQFVRKP